MKVDYFMLKFSQKILIAAILMAFALPSLALAAGLQLETIYPSSPSAQQVITGKAKLPDIIRYVIDWTIIIAALAVAFSLVYAGVQYLTSVGRPNAMTAARSRIGKCLIGLLIIVSSYLILQTINPQLTIMTIKKQQVGSGIIMFTQAGLYGSDKDASGASVANKCYTAPIPDGGSCAIVTASVVDCYNPNAVNGFNTADSDTLENLMKASEARFLGYDIPNTTVEFGNMAWESASKTVINFTKFPLYAIGFWGDESTQGGALVKDTKIFAYSNTQYNGSLGDKANRAIEYQMDGKIGKDGTTSNAAANDGRASCKAATAGSGAADFAMQFITIRDDFDKNFYSEAPYYDTTLIAFDPNNPGQPIRALKPHPPLSIRAQGEGLGVILYASENGGSRTFANSVEDFNLSNIKFDNLADDIKVDNTASMAKLIKECKDQSSDPTEQKNCMIKSWRRDFLAIVHSGYYFAGDLRMFFEKRGNSDSNIFPDDPPVQFPKLFKEDFVSGWWRSIDVALQIDLYDKIEKKDTLYGGGEYCGVGDCCSDKGVIGDCTKSKSDWCKGDYCLGKGLGEPSSGYDASSFYYLTDEYTSFGNQGRPTPAAGYTKIAINEIDQFGRLKTSDKASSLELFEIEKKQGAYWIGNNVEGGVASKKQSIVCREVKLCTGKGLLNNCLVFVPNTPDEIQKKYKDYNSIVLPMPFYIPVNLPRNVKAMVKFQDESGITKIDLKDGFDFNDKIKSLSIEGDCLVVLFENGIKNMDECFDCSANGTADASCKKCWDGGGPGGNSEVFTQSVSDLTSHAISKCGGRESFGFGDPKNCASAIAIFPIKKSAE